ncbi:tRNA preQ1(34) S-adenosylmethionine ribosyltransferase-isomerase QueA [Candidatus Uhrbacteria bacterium]|nr:tRNA preQ1(34) S-adenosylmethionine ribosyltransferase-isomerase QueA [Candidatus Uhrbacteria bacterium]
MATPVSLFDYDLPQELIAQHSVEPRDHSRLMVVGRKTGERQHKRFYEIVDELHPGDALVMNNTKVFRARLEATVQSVSLRAQRSNPSIELFLLRPRNGMWEALVKPGRHIHVGDTIHAGELEGKVISKSDIVTINFVQSDKIVLDYANAHGQIPIPPYVYETPKTLEQYQTVYAQETGSVAAPTAGFHFTQELLEKIRAKGVEIHYVTLHVGLGTFRPMKSETLEAHEMHREFVTIDSNTTQAINRAKQEGRRVIAVGTTTVRTLEGVAALHHGHIEPFTGDVNLFITPGFEFKVVDALITNFHLPKSTLLVLVSAFATREHIFSAYQEAIREHYRFFSFGDAMFISIRNIDENKRIVYTSARNSTNQVEDNDHPVPP